MWLCVFFYLVLRLSFFLILSRTSAFLVCLFAVFFFALFGRTNHKATYSVQSRAHAKGEDTGKIIMISFLLCHPPVSCLCRALLAASGYCSHLLRALSFIVIYFQRLREVMKSHTWYRVVTQKVREDYLWNSSDLIGNLILWHKLFLKHVLHNLLGYSYQTEHII